MKLVHIHMHFPWALLSLNLGQVFNPLNEFGAAKLCLLGTAPRQMQKSSSFINTKLNLASHISVNRARKHFCTFVRVGVGEREEGAVLECLQKPRSGTPFLHMKTQIFTHIAGYEYMYCHCHRLFKTQIVKN